MTTPLPPVAILAGGLATRLRPLAEKYPKALIDVAGKPFIVHQLELLRRNGLSRVVICAGYLGEMIQEALGDGSAFGMSIHYSFDGSALLGTAGALKKASLLLGDAFFVLYGDSYLECSYPEINAAFQGCGKPGLLAVYHNENRWDTSNIVYAAGKVSLYDKRRQNPDMRYIDYGVSILKTSTLSSIPLTRPTDLGDLYHDLSTRDMLAGFEVFQRFYEIGSFEGLQETRDYLASHKPDAHSP